MEFPKHEREMVLRDLMHILDMAKFGMLIGKCLLKDIERYL